MIQAIFKFSQKLRIKTGFPLKLPDLHHLMFPTVLQRNAA
ncbi:hypothetical protein SPONN_426 [uncultured Candidatus Thioglobus sp.]|nr:hypothetical protein SPONN_426 [uncultured Candidatus Thioglobus sp.]